MHLVRRVVAEECVCPHKCQVYKGHQVLCVVEVKGLLVNDLPFKGVYAQSVGGRRVHPLSVDNRRKNGVEGIVIEVLPQHPFGIVSSLPCCGPWPRRDPGVDGTYQFSTGGQVSFLLSLVFVPLRERSVSRFGSSTPSSFRMVDRSTLDIVACIV